MEGNKVVVAGIPPQGDTLASGLRDIRVEKCFVILRVTD